MLKAKQNNYGIKILGGSSIRVWKRIENILGCAIDLKRLSNWNLRQVASWSVDSFIFAELR
jgi:hypothetical protein